MRAHAIGELCLPPCSTDETVRIKRPAARLENHEAFRRRDAHDDDGVHLPHGCHDPARPPLFDLVDKVVREDPIAIPQQIPWVVSQGKASRNCCTAHSAVGSGKVRVTFR